MHRHSTIDPGCRLIGIIYYTYSTQYILYKISFTIHAYYFYLSILVILLDRSTILFFDYFVNSVGFFRSSVLKFLMYKNDNSDVHFEFVPNEPFEPFIREKKLSLAQMAQYRGSIGS